MTAKLCLTNVKVISEDKVGLFELLGREHEITIENTNDFIARRWFKSYKTCGDIER